jgi:sugar O-acyltransferase (sialic acid O-acetyltransferase NeuD family)
VIAAADRVVLVGAGGFGRETAGLIASLVGVEAIGFLDDDPLLQGKTLAGLEVLGALDRLDSMPEASVVVTLGNPRDPAIRQRIVERLGLPVGRYRTLIHPLATVGPDVRIGEGTVVHAGSVFTQGIEIGRHVAAMPNVVLTHDDRVGDFVTFGAGVMLAGGVAVEDSAYIGSGATVREGCRIGLGATIGMGSVVLSDVPPGETWAGVPAQRIR